MHTGVMETRIFIYIRLCRGEEILARTKIREYGALGSLLADFLRQVRDNDLELPPGPPPALQYVDANTGETLISFRVDVQRAEQVIQGRIPAAYRARMLDPQESSCSTGDLIERGAPDLPEREKRALAELLASPRSNVLKLIRGAIDADGLFEVRVPIGQRND